MSVRRYQSPAPPPQQQCTVPWANPSIVAPSAPPYFRPTIAAIPGSARALNDCRAPLALVVSPADVAGAPCADLRNTAFARCARCAAYMSPYARATADGAAQCPFCGGRIDGAAARAEFRCSVYDALAPAAFGASGAPAARACVFFLVDISDEAVRAGYAAQALASLRASASALPDDVCVGLATFDNAVTLYDFRRSSTFVIADLTQPIAPREPVARVGDCREAFCAVVDEVAEALSTVRPHGHCLGSALALTEIALKGTGGLVLCFCCGHPTVGPMALPERTATAGTPEDKLIFNSGDSIEKLYRRTGFALNRAAVSVHLFMLASPTQQIAEVSVVGFISRLTGGIVHFYEKFDPLRLHADIHETCTKKYLWGSSMRMRCSEGITVKSIYCNCSLRGQTVYFPVVAPDTTIAFELEIEPSFKGQNALFQAAFLWIDSSQQKMVRIFTFEFPVTNDIQKLRESIDEGALAVYLAKAASNDIIMHGSEISISNIQKARSGLSSVQHLLSTTGTIESLLSSTLLRQRRELRDIDRKMEACYNIQSSSLADTLLYLYPRLIAVDTGTAELPLTAESFAAGHCFLLHTNRCIYVWVSPAAPKEYLEAVFGVTDAAALPSELPPLRDTPASSALHQRVRECYELCARYLITEVIAPGSPSERILSDIINK